MSISRICCVPRPPPSRFAFDLIEIEGEDLRREPLLTRKSTLLSLLKGAPASVVYNEHLEGDGAMIFRRRRAGGNRGSAGSVGELEPLASAGPGITAAP
jgi:hypothetical protein